MPLFLILNFCKFLYQKSTPIKDKTLKFSKKVLNFIINGYKKSRPCFRHFCAKTIWISVPVLRATLVHMTCANWYVNDNVSKWFK